MRTFALMLLLLATVHGAQSQLSKKEVSDAVRAVVAAQLAALKVDDYEKAYEFASTQIKKQFPLTLFAEMVKRGYPALAGHARAEPGLVYDNREGRAGVVISVYDERDMQVDYRYLLALEDGAWRIDGVVLEPRRSLRENL